MMIIVVYIILNQRIRNMTGNATVLTLLPRPMFVASSFQHPSLRLNIVLDRIYNAKICDFGLTQFGLQDLRLLSCEFRLHDSIHVSVILCPKPFACQTYYIPLYTI